MRITNDKVQISKKSHVSTVILPRAGDLRIRGRYLMLYWWVIGMGWNSGDGAITALGSIPIEMKQRGTTGHHNHNSLRMGRNSNVKPYPGNQRSCYPLSLLPQWRTRPGSPLQRLPPHLPPSCSFHRKVRPLG